MDVLLNIIHLLLGSCVLVFIEFYCESAVLVAIFKVFAILTGIFAIFIFAILAGIFEFFTGIFAILTGIFQFFAVLAVASLIFCHFDRNFWHFEQHF